MKIAIIGTSTIANQFMAAKKFVKEIEVIAVCSRDIKKARTFADNYNIEFITNDYRELLEVPIDGVYLAVPNNLHKKQALFFLENKVAVLCEKPLGSNYGEVKEMIDCAKKNSTLLTEGLFTVYTENFKLIKEKIKTIGIIRRAVFSLGQYSSRYDKYREGVVLRAFNPEFASGSVMDLGIYTISLALALFGKPHKIMANSYNLDSGVDGLGSVILSYEDKEVILLHSKITNELLKSEILGEDGNIQFESVSLLNNATLYINGENPERFTKNDDKTIMHFELKEFVAAFNDKRVETKSLTHQMILDAHYVLTEVRKQTNVVFDSDNQAIL